MNLSPGGSGSHEITTSGRGRYGEAHAPTTEVNRDVIKTPPETPLSRPAPRFMQGRACGSTIPNRAIWHRGHALVMELVLRDPRRSFRAPSAPTHCRSRADRRGPESAHEVDRASRPQARQHRVRAGTVKVLTSAWPRRWAALQPERRTPDAHRARAAPASSARPPWRPRARGKRCRQARGRLGLGVVRAEMLSAGRRRGRHDH